MSTPADEREQDQAALPPLRDATLREERADRGCEPDEPADERQPRDAAMAPRLHADAHAAVAAGESPEALTGDHDPVGARHPAEPRPYAHRVGAGEDLDDGGVRPHPPRVPHE